MGKKGQNATIFLIVVAVIFFYLVSFYLTHREDAKKLKELQSNYTQLKEDYDKLQQEYDTLRSNYEQLKKETSRLMAEYLVEETILDLLLGKKYRLICTIIKINLVDTFPAIKGVPC